LAILNYINRGLMKRWGQLAVNCCISSRRRRQSARFDLVLTNSTQVPRYPIDVPRYRTRGSRFLFKVSRYAEMAVSVCGSNIHPAWHVWRLCRAARPGRLHELDWRVPRCPAECLLWSAATRRRFDSARPVAPFLPWASPCEPSQRLAEPGQASARRAPTSRRTP